MVLKRIHGEVVVNLDRITFATVDYDTHEKMWYVRINFDTLPGCDISFALMADARKVLDELTT